MSAPTAIQTRRTTLWARVAPLLVLPVPLAWFAYVLAFNPTDTIADPTGPCLWHKAFGIDGPSCGITRMTWYLLHGNLIDAARMHLAALIAVPIVGYAYLHWAAATLFGRKLPTPRHPKRWIIGYAVFFLLYAVVLRNLPWPPFSWFYVPDLTP